ncbi:hypothetical protein ACFL0U_04480 [Pseudomonadota bacterium]
MEFLRNISNGEVQIAIIRVLIIFVVLLVLVFLVRLFFNITLFFLVRKYKGYRKKKKLKFDKKDVASTPKEDEELLRDKESELVGVEKIPVEYDPEQELGEEGEIEEGKIVGIAEPIGFWTSLILGQKLTFLVNQAHYLSQKGKKGFWVALVEAQGRSRDRQRGRGGRY